MESGYHSNIIVLPALHIWPERVGNLQVGLYIFQQCTSSCSHAHPCRDSFSNRNDFSLWLFEVLISSSVACRTLLCNLITEINFFLKSTIDQLFSQENIKLLLCQQTVSMHQAFPLRASSFGGLQNTMPKHMSFNISM